MDAGKPTCSSTTVRDHSNPHKRLSAHRTPSFAPCACDCCFSGSSNRSCPGTRLRPPPAATSPPWRSRDSPCTVSLVFTPLLSTDARALGRAWASLQLNTILTRRGTQNWPAVVRHLTPLCLQCAYQGVSQSSLNDNFPDGNQEVSSAEVKV